jgi:hypothetical protein
MNSLAAVKGSGASSRNEILYFIAIGNVTARSDVCAIERGSGI